LSAEGVGGSEFKIEGPEVELEVEVNGLKIELPESEDGDSSSGRGEGGFCAGDTDDEGGFA
jgi:hypothetical protein